MHLNEKGMETKAFLALDRTGHPAATILFGQALKKLGILEIFLQNQGVLFALKKINFGRGCELLPPGDVFLTGRWHAVRWAGLHSYRGQDSHGQKTHAVVP